ncbi:jg26708 [Pararge aegeria aegeria]|uniref:Jg26708 protein n=1 Tax=Pararge aegeria aegeria TaxID=348720 RepID=A0A8S4QNV6_9NEOP|nr:jg26708 [Pararge aegeria aegeria]
MEKLKRKTILINILNIISNILLIDESDNIKHQIFNIIISDDDIGKLIIPVLKDTKDTWEKYVEYKNEYLDIEEWHKQLDLVGDNKFIHKCMETDTDVQEMEFNDNIDALRKTKSNFDLGDIDSLFEESDEEPVSKKAKFDFDVDNLIGKIESNVEQLCQVKENVLSEYKSRIKCVCDRLRNIVS